MTYERLVAAMMGALLRAMPRKIAVSCVSRMLRRYTRGKAPDEALRFLFEIDVELYGLEGRGAKAYGDGVHTKHRHTEYHRFFTQRIAAEESVLDVGCGAGELAEDIAATCGAAVTGIDIDPKKLAVARERSKGQVCYVLGDVVEKLPSDHADVVVLSNVLEHLEGRGEMLRELVRRVTPRRLLLRVPLFERDWRVPLRRELGVEWRLDPTHQIEYTKESFSAEMAEAGLEISHQEIRWGELWAEARPEARGR